MSDNGYYTTTYGILEKDVEDAAYREDFVNRLLNKMKEVQEGTFKFEKTDRGVEVALSWATDEGEPV